jgi:N-methylhydantoinase A
MDSFLQGKLKLDREAAFNAISERIAKPLGYQGDEGVDRAAQGILDLAAATMAGVIKELTIERGHDVREFVLFPFGGGGPLFASNLARQLRIPKVIIPPHPGNFSTLGMLTAGARIDLSRMVLAEITADALVKVLEAFNLLEREARDTMKLELGVDEVRFDRSLEMRYRGQKHSVRVPFELAMDLIAVKDAFQQIYLARFGHANNSPVEVLEVRLGVDVDMPAPNLLNLKVNHQAPPTTPLPSSRRPVFFAAVHGRIEVDVWRRDTLPTGFVIHGPAVVEEFSSTTILMPGDIATVGALGEISIQLQ